jgi:hypothetical protein
MKILIPTSLEDVTIEQFIKYNRITKLEEVDDEVIMVSVIANFCDLSVEDVLKIPVKDMKEIAQQIVDVLNTEPRDIQIYKDLGRIPNFDKISAGEYIDLDKYFTDPENYHRAMAVLYRPIKKKLGSKYILEDYKGSDDTCESMLKLPLELLLSSMVFFSNLNRELLKATRDFLQQPTAETDLLEKHLAENGAGINQFTQLLEETILILNEQRKPISINFSLI